MTLDPETMRTVLKSTGPIIGFLVLAACGFRAQGWVLGILAGLLGTLAAGVLLGVLSRL